MPDSLTHYVPILRARKGELDALRRTRCSVHDRMTPLLELMPRGVNEQGKPTKTLDEHLAALMGQLAAARGDRDIFIDPEPLIRIEELNPVSVIRLVAQAAADAEIAAVPVTAPGRGGGYQAQVAQTIREGVGRLCVRLTADRYGDAASLPQRLDALLRRCGIEPGLVHIVIDMGSDIAVIARTLLAFLPRRDEWHRITLVMGGFPVSLSDVEHMARVPRADWKMWQTIRAAEQSLSLDEDDDGGVVLAPRSAGFGDYGPRAAATADVPYRPAPNLRYTVEDEWLIVRGTGGPAARPDQIYDLCRTVYSERGFQTRDYSWGDAWIADRAHGQRPGPGNPTTWITVALTHHLRMVTDQLASLSGP